MARERLNGYLHPDVIVILKDIAATHHFRSVMPAIEMVVKNMRPDALQHVIPGKYGTQIEKEEADAVWKGSTEVQNAK